MIFLLSLLTNCKTRNKDTSTVKGAGQYDPVVSNTITKFSDPRPRRSSKHYTTFSVLDYDYSNTKTGFRVVIPDKL